MENHSGIIRGLINDLLRSLSAALLHIDELMLKLDSNSNDFPEAILINEQLVSSIAHFLELRSELFYVHENFIENNTNFLTESSPLPKPHFSHGLNDFLTAVLGSCDLILFDNNQKRVKDKISIINDSIKKFMPHIEHIYKKDLTKAVEIDNRGTEKKNEKLNKLLRKQDIKILLVEDDDEVRKITSIALKKEGYVLFGCKDAKAAMDIFKENGCINFCLIDIGLPDMNGARLADKLWSQQNKLNILLTTGHDEAIVNGQYDIKKKFEILRKPYRISKLINKLESLW